MVIKKKTTIPFVIGVLVVMYCVYTVVSTVLNHNAKVRTDVNTLKLAANVYSLKNGTYPSTLAELMTTQNITPIGSSTGNYTYETTSNDCKITASLWIEGPYSVKCSDN